MTMTTATATTTTKALLLYPARYPSLSYHDRELAWALGEREALSLQENVNWDEILDMVCFGLQKHIVKQRRRAGFSENWLSFLVPADRRDDFLTLRGEALEFCRERVKLRRDSSVTNEVTRRWSSCSDATYRLLFAHGQWTDSAKKRKVSHVPDPDCTTNDELTTKKPRLESGESGAEAAEKKYVVVSVMIDGCEEGIHDALPTFGEGIELDPNFVPRKAKISTIACLEPVHRTVGGPLRWIPHRFGNPPEISPEFQELAFLLEQEPSSFDHVQRNASEGLQALIQSKSHLTSFRSNRTKKVRCLVGEGPIRKLFDEYREQLRRDVFSRIAPPTEEEEERRSSYSSRPTEKSTSSRRSNATTVETVCLEEGKMSNSKVTPKDVGKTLTLEEWKMTKKNPTPRNAEEKANAVSTVNTAETGGAQGCAGFKEGDVGGVNGVVVHNGLSPEERIAIINRASTSLTHAKKIGDLTYRSSTEIAFDDPASVQETAQLLYGGALEMDAMALVKPITASPKDDVTDTTVQQGGEHAIKTPGVGSSSNDTMNPEQKRADRKLGGLGTDYGVFKKPASSLKTKDVRFDSKQKKSGSHPSPKATKIPYTREQTNLDRLGGCSPRPDQTKESESNFAQINKDSQNEPPLKPNVPEVSPVAKIVAAFQKSVAERIQKASAAAAAAAKQIDEAQASLLLMETKAHSPVELRTVHAESPSKRTNERGNSKVDDKVIVVDSGNSSDESPVNQVTLELGDRTSHGQPPSSVLVTEEPSECRMDDARTHASDLTMHDSDDDPSGLQRSARSYTSMIRSYQLFSSSMRREAYLLLHICQWNSWHLTSHSNGAVFAKTQESVINAFRDDELTLFRHACRQATIHIPHGSRWLHEMSKVFSTVREKTFTWWCGLVQGCCSEFANQVPRLWNDFEYTQRSLWEYFNQLELAIRDYHFQEWLKDGPTNTAANTTTLLDQQVSVQPGTGAGAGTGLYVQRYVNSVNRYLEMSTSSRNKHFMKISTNSWKTWIRSRSDERKSRVSFLEGEEMLLEKFRAEESALVDLNFRTPYLRSFDNAFGRPLFAREIELYLTVREKLWHLFCREILLESWKSFVAQDDLSEEEFVCHQTTLWEYFARMEQAILKVHGSRCSQLAAGSWVTPVGQHKPNGVVNAESQVINLVASPSPAAGPTSI